MLQCCYNINYVNMSNFSLIQKNQTDNEYR